MSIGLNARPAQGTSVSPASPPAAQKMAVPDIELPKKSSTSKKFKRPTAGDFLAYFQHGTNRDIVKALAWSYGPSLALSGLVLVPFGGFLAVLGIIPAWLAERRGDKLKTHLEASGRLDATTGPLARLAKLNHFWDQADEPPKQGANIPHKMMGEFNRLLDELFPKEAKQKSADRIREWLKMSQGSRGFTWLNHGFNARQYYMQTFWGRQCRNFRHLGAKIPFTPVHVITRIPDLILMGATLLFRWDRISKLAHHI